MNNNTLLRIDQHAMLKERVMNNPNTVFQKNKVLVRFNRPASACVVRIESEAAMHPRWMGSHSDQLGAVTAEDGK